MFLISRCFFDQKNMSMSKESNTELTTRWAEVSWLQLEITYTQLFCDDAAISNAIFSF
jgi:hypothetical protein